MAGTSFELWISEPVPVALDAMTSPVGPAEFVRVPETVNCFPGSIVNSFPLFISKVPLTVNAVFDKRTPAELSMVKLFTEVGKFAPVTWVEYPLNE